MHAQEGASDHEHQLSCTIHLGFNLIENNNVKYELPHFNIA